MSKTNLHDKLTLLGSSVASDTPAGAPDPGVLEKFANPQAIQEYNPASTDLRIQLDIPDFTSLCPVTGQPDYAVLKIVYTPDEWCVETKSLKIYLQGYRNIGVFNEACITKITSDLVALLKPTHIRIEGAFTPRGGITVRPVSEWTKD